MIKEAEVKICIYSFKNLLSVYHVSDTLHMWGIEQKNSCPYVASCVYSI